MFIIVRTFTVITRYFVLAENARSSYNRKTFVGQDMYMYVSRDD